MNQIEHYYSMKKAVANVSPEVYELAKEYAYEMRDGNVLEIWVSNIVAALERRSELVGREETLLELLKEARDNDATVLRINP